MLPAAGGGRPASGQAIRAAGERGKAEAEARCIWAPLEERWLEGAEELGRTWQGMMHGAGVHVEGRSQLRTHRSRACSSQLRGLQRWIFCFGGRRELAGQLAHYPTGDDIEEMPAGPVAGGASGACRTGSSARHEKNKWPGGLDSEALRCHGRRPCST